MFSGGPCGHCPPQQPLVPQGSEHGGGQHGPQAGQDGGDDHHGTATASGSRGDGARAGGWKEVV